MEEQFKCAVKKEAAKGLIYICATPIGNLEDTSFRLVKTLSEADFIIAEDTRTTRKILLRFNIKKPPNSIISYQDYSKQSKVDYIIELLKTGHSAALVSESGIPSIQDPGYKIINKCIEEKINISVIPGPNAALSALVLSGLATDSFLFLGFLPKTKSKRLEKIRQISSFPYTLIIYESPLRLLKLLEDILQTAGDRAACIARELTKIHEEIIRGKISDLIAELKTRQLKGKILKGEIVLVVEGLKEKHNSQINEAAIIKEFKEIISRNVSKKEAIKILRDRYNIARNTLYNISLKI